MTIGISLKEAKDLLEMNQCLILINRMIDDFKLHPGDSSSVKIQFLHLKQGWDHLVLSQSTGQQGNYQIIDIAMRRTQNRVEKLLKKYPLAMETAEQQPNPKGLFSFNGPKMGLLALSLVNLHLEYTDIVQTGLNSISNAAAFPLSLQGRCTQCQTRQMGLDLTTNKVHGYCCECARLTDRND